MTEDEIILTHILQCKAIDLALNKPVLTEIQRKQFEDYKRRRTNGEPLQYILGTCNFMGLELAVTPSVLVPRPETEQLVDQALKQFKGQDSLKILDLGTGSGNIAVALAKFLPGSEIVTVEISPEAIEVARANAKRHQVDDRIEFLEGDFTSNKMMHVIYYKARRKDGKKGFDLMISNPPYIPTAQLGVLPKDVRREPAAALDGGPVGLNFYPVIIKYSAYLLRDGACLMMEFGDGQSEALKGLLEAQPHFSNITIYKDLAGRDRIIYGKIHY